MAIAMVLSLCACGGSQSAPPAGDSNKTQEQADSAEEKQEAAEPAAESAEPAAEAEAPAAEAEGTAADTAMEIDTNERRLTRPQVFEPAHVDALGAILLHYDLYTYSIASSTKADRAHRALRI